MAEYTASYVPYLCELDGFTFICIVPFYILYLRELGWYGYLGIMGYYLRNENFHA